MKYWQNENFTRNLLNYLSNKDIKPLNPRRLWNIEPIIIAPCSSLIICLNFCIEINRQWNYEVRDTFDIKLKEVAPFQKGIISKSSNMWQNILISSRKLYLDFRTFQVTVENLKDITVDGILALSYWTYMLRKISIFLSIHDN